MKSWIVFIGCCAMLTLTGCGKQPVQQDPPGVCGGIGNVPCPTDQYCEYPADAHCGIADATGVCKTKPEICPANYAPVCGCDDKTYGNDCTATRAGVSVKYKGKCGGKGNK